MNQNTETVVTLVHYNVAVRDTLEYCLQKNVYDVKAFAAKKNTLLNEIDNNTPLKAILDNSGDNGKKMDEAIRKMVEEIYGENSTICKVSGDNLIADTQRRRITELNGISRSAATPSRSTTTSPR